MQLALVGASLKKFAESNFDFSIPSLKVTRESHVYKSQKVKFSEVNGNWQMTVTVHDKKEFTRPFAVTLMVDCNLPNHLDYDKYILNVDVMYNQWVILKFPHYFLKEKMDFHSNIEIRDRNVTSVSFHVKMTLSCYPNSDEYVDKTVVLKQIISNNISMLSDSTYSDFTFVVDSEEFKVHKNILAATSPVFVKLFNSEMQESIKNKCIVNDITSNTFNHMLRFIYGGILPDEIADIAFSLYEAAHYYHIKNLMDICEKAIRLNLSASNACSVFLWAELYNMEDLKSSALKQLNVGENRLSSEMITNMLKQKENELLTLKSLVNLQISK